MKVAHHRRGVIGGFESVHDFGNGLGRWFCIDGDPNNFRARVGQLHYLPGSGFGIGGVGVGHGLNYDGVVSTNPNSAHIDGLRNTPVF